MSSEPYHEPVLVAGVYTPAGYFNHPSVRYCDQTGVCLEASRPVRADKGPRPPLGVLTFDDGSTVAVRWDMVVGRDPSSSPLVRSGEAAPLRLTDMTLAGSRCHFLVALRGWEVVVADLGSRNGTWLLRGGGDRWRRLWPADLATLGSGDQVGFGGRFVTFHHRHAR